MDEEITIEITSKDYVFYRPHYTKILQGEEKGLSQSIRNVTNQLGKLQHGEELYNSQEALLNRYKDRLVKNRDTQTQPIDATNELFVAYITKQLIAKEKMINNNLKKKSMLKEKKAKEQTFLQGFYKSENTANRAHRQTKRDYDYFYRRMCQIDDEMPQYMKDSLENMPTNKGYIYRGVWYFGKIPVHPEEERKYLTMFERFKGIQYIHEYIREYPHKTYNVYEKLSKNSPKTLIRQSFLKDK